MNDFGDTLEKENAYIVFLTVISTIHQLVLKRLEGRKELTWCFEVKNLSFLTKYGQQAISFWSNVAILHIVLFKIVLVSEALVLEFSNMGHVLTIPMSYQNEFFLY